MAEFTISIFSIFDQAFGTAWRVEVIKHVLKQKGKPLLRDIEARLRQLIIINGFRDPLKAPSAILVKKVKKLSFKFPEIMDLFVQAFLELRPEILAGAGQALAAQQNFSEVFEENGYKKEGNDKKVLVGLVKEQQQQLVAESGYQEQEAILACLCFLYKQADSSGQEQSKEEIQEQKTGDREAEEQGREGKLEQENEQQVAPSIDLNKWLGMLAALPPGDQLWEGFAAFLEKLQKLANEKRKQQEEESLIGFQKRLCFLEDEYKEEVGFFCCEKLFGSNWENIAPAELTQINKLINDLAELFSAYRELCNKTPGTVFEERRQQALLRKKENQVLELLQSFPQFSGFQVAAPIPAGIADKGEKEVVALSLREIALLLKREDCNEHRQAFFWRLIKESDLTGAYWFNKSLTAAGRPSLLPDWLLEALIASQWLSSDAPYLIAELSQIAIIHQPGEFSLHQLLGVASALCPTVTAPAAGMLSWLRTPACCPALHDLIVIVQEFAAYEEAEDSVDFAGINGAESCESAIQEKTQIAKEWLEEAKNLKTKNKRASDVWQEIVCRKDYLPALFLPLLGDKRSSVDKVRFQVNQWSDRNYIKEKINEIDLRLVGRKMRPITGEPREQIICCILEACKKATDWCDLVEYEDKIKKQGDSWPAEQIKKLRTGVQGILEQLVAELIELMEGRDLALAAASSCLGRSLAHLCWNIGLENPLSNCFPETGFSAGEWLPRGAKSLAAGLSQRLWLLPEVNIDQSGSPSDEGLLKVSSALRDSYIDGRTLKRAFNGWLEKKDFRFLEALLQVIEEKEKLEEAEDCRVAWENELAELQLIT